MYLCKQKGIRNSVICFEQFHSLPNNIQPPMLKCLFVFIVSFFSLSVLAQDKKIDSSIVNEQTLESDALTDDDYAALFDDLEAFLDSLLKPRSYLLINLSMSRGYFNYKV